jgi:transcriptional regulator with XRE-family HTH domain
MAYGGFKGRDELADAIEISSSTLQRIEGLAEPARAPKRSELLAIAEACDVPMWFLEGGWEGWRRSVDAEAQDALADLAARRQRPSSKAEGE